MSKPQDPPAMGRRERNKRQKLQRIVSAADRLFAQHGVDAVTTQQVAAEADVATGTLFLYAKTKGELVMLVHNDRYAEMLGDAANGGPGLAPSDTRENVMGVLHSFVACNLANSENGRAYLRELVFGDSVAPHHAAGRTILEDMESRLAEILARKKPGSREQFAARARAVVAIMLYALALREGGQPRSTEEVMADIRAQVSPLLSPL